MHAVGNALALSSDLSGPALLRALNAIAPDVYFTRAREVTASFRPRAAERRWYRYFEPSDGHSLARWKEGASLLTGNLDARSFGRGFPAGLPAVRTIDRIEVAAQGEMFQVDLQARSFVWGMVRKIISALRAFDAGELAVADLTQGAAGRRRLGLPLAEPEGLVLWDVVYAEPWEFEAVRSSAIQAEATIAARRALRVRGAILEALQGVVPSASRGNQAVGL